MRTTRVGLSVLVFLAAGAVLAQAALRSTPAPSFNTFTNVGDAGIGGNLSVNGTTTTGALVCTGTATAGTSNPTFLQVVSDAGVGGNLRIIGTENPSLLQVVSDAGIGGNLGILGSVFLSGSETAAGTIHAANFDGGTALIQTKTTVGYTASGAATMSVNSGLNTSNAPSAWGANWSIVGGVDPSGSGTGAKALGIGFDTTNNVANIWALAPSSALYPINVHATATKFTDGAATPTVKFTITGSTGAVQFAGVATGSLPTCNAGAEGTVQYDTTVHTLYVCNGTEFVDLNASSTPTWSNLSLQNSWVNFGGAFATAQYTKINGIVYVKGLIKSGTTTSTTLLFTLPAGYRPAETHVFNVPINGGSTTSVVNVANDGQVTAAATLSATWTSLEQIRFPAEQ